MRRASNPFRLLSVLGLLGVGLSFSLAACGDDDGAGAITKSEASALPFSEWTEDYCDTKSWYGDGVCDSFCPEPDDDCIDQDRCGGIAGIACLAGEVCDLESCATDAEGTCVVEPQACAEYYSPVCGCDGLTYGNDCERLAAGAGFDHMGACDEAPMCGGIAGLACAAGEVCDILECALDAAGLCVPEPEACAMIYAPVCGCDGATYGNDCERLGAGAALDHQGTCDATSLCGGIAGVPCAMGEVCDIQSCNVDEAGVCVPEPEACAEIYAPVCGCDGVTYGNDCERLGAGVPLDHEGACDATGSCGPYPGGECMTGEVCDIRTCGLGGSGECVPEPEACAEIYAPVCGCDGFTYGNDCERLAAGAALAYTGPCI